MVPQQELFVCSIILPPQGYRAIHQDSPVFLNSIIHKVWKIRQHKLNFWCDYLYGSFCQV